MKIGYQMYSARDLVQDPEGMRSTLEALAKMGYDGVEFFLYAGTDPLALKQMLAEYGLEAIGTHVHKPRWEADTDGEIDYAVQAGIPRLVYPWVAPEERNEESFRKIQKDLVLLAEKCAAKGIQLQYHNHNFEFEKMGTGRVIDFLLEESDAYTFELDTFWSTFAGEDTPAYMEKLGPRVPMIHVKDYTGVNETGYPVIVPIGKGILDNVSIIRKAKEMDKQWLIVELDNGPYPILESAKMSIDYIRNVLNADW